MMLESVAV